MRTLICYSSRTGNTRKLANAADSVTPFEHDLKEIVPGEEIDYTGYDLMVIGYWVESSKADNNTLEFIRKIRNRNIVLFGTCGTDPDNPYVKSILSKTAKEVDGSNRLLGHYICRGEISGKVIEDFETFVRANPGNRNLELMLGIFREQYPGSAGHPDEKDLSEAKAWFKNIFETIA